MCGVNQFQGTTTDCTAVRIGSQHRRSKLGISIRSHRFHKIISPRRLNDALRLVEKVALFLWASFSKIDCCRGIIFGIMKRCAILDIPQ